MAKSYLSTAQHHAEKIKHYYDHAGANGYSQAIHHYHAIGECYSKSAAKRLGEATVLQSMYGEARKLMEEMKNREAGKGDVALPSGPPPEPSP